MAKKYDASLKVLLESHLPDWLTLVPRKPRGPVRVIDADVATVTADADKVVFVEDSKPWILHVELQSKRDPSLEWRVPLYNALLEYKHRCDVHSLVVLLTKKAQSPGLTGEWARAFEGEPPYRYLRYQVVRAWEFHAEELARGPWGLFPLAPLCDDAPPNLDQLAQIMGRRLSREHSNRNEARELGAITNILLGLRYTKEVAALIIDKVNTMIDLEESTTYQQILARGKAEGEVVGEAKGKIEALHDTILRQGKKKFGKPSPKLLRAFSAIKDESRLTALSERILDVDSWKDLLAP